MTDRLLPAVLLIKAVALACARCPNSTATGSMAAFEQSHAIHVGVAISLRGGGLVAPALHDADKQRSHGVDASAPGSRRARPRRLAQELGAHRPDDHDHEPRRAGRRIDIRHHLSAAGRAGRLREDRRSDHGCVGGNVVRGRSSPPRSRPIIARPTVIAARCCSPRSTGCYRSRRSYDLERTDHLRRLSSRR